MPADCYHGCRWMNTEFSLGKARLPGRTCSWDGFGNQFLTYLVVTRPAVVALSTNTPAFLQAASLPRRLRACSLGSNVFGYSRKSHQHQRRRPPDAPGTNPE